MRLIYLAHAVIPSRSANSINIMKMCAAFRRNGHDVTLLAPERPGRDAGVADVFDYYGVDSRFDIRFLPWGRYPGRSYGYALRTALRSRRMQADLVYTRFLSGAAAAVRLGNRVVFEAHARLVEQTRLGELFVRSMARHRRFARLVVISEALRADCATRTPSLASKLLVAHDGADPLPVAAIPAELPGASGALTVGYVGQLYAGKGMELIVRLAPLCPWAQFHVVGGSTADVELWKTRSQSIPNLHLHGFVPPSQVPRYLRAFDVLLAPYQRTVSVFGGGGDVAKWMSPLKLFEYMAADRPIVCSELPVLKEIVQDGTTAVLCDPESATAWSAALARLRDDVSLRRSLAEAARRRFDLHHTWTARAQRVLEGL
jgi:glycosyltransferase involved in cell wall biosynthesis